MGTRSMGRIARARVIPPPQLSLLSTATEDLRAALRPGFRDERYRRLWRVGQMHEGEDHLYGHLGFEAQVGADLWDESRQDFESREIPNGLASPFVIRLSDFVMLFQPRRQDIRVSSFIGALRSLLRTSTADSGWEVVPLTGESDFDEWRLTVEYVVRVKFRLAPDGWSEIPPDGLAYLMAGADPETAVLDLRSRTGLNLDGPVVRELLGYARAGLGEMTAVGRCSEDEESVWTSSIEAESSWVEAPVDPATGEVGREVLLEQLSRIKILGR